MEIVVILLILIVIVFCVLIFGGLSQREEERLKRKKRREAERLAKKEVSEKNKEIKKAKNEFIDIIEKSNDIEPVEKGTTVEAKEYDEESYVSNIEKDHEDIAKSGKEVSNVDDIVDYVLGKESEKVKEEILSEELIDNIKSKESNDDVGNVENKKIVHTKVKER